jgi:hypothetical protein
MVAVRVAVVVLVIGAVASVASCDRRVTPAPAADVVEATAAPTHTDPIDDERRAIRVLVEAGKLDDALLRLDRLVASGLDVDLSALVLCDRAAVLSRRAAAATDLKARERDLRAAIADCTTEPALVRGLADTLLRRARDLGANDDTLSLRRALLRDSVEVLPTVPALVDLALLLEHDDDLAAAVDAVNEAIALQAKEQQTPDPRLVALKQRLEQHNVVEGSFKSAKHSHFVARFEGYGEERLAWGALDTLEQAYFSVGKALDVYPTQPITVVIYTGAQYQQATAGPDWSTGLFDGKIRIREGQLAADRGLLNDTLLHEYVHAVLHTLPSSVPVWFHEGLAQHFEQQRPAPSVVLPHTGVAPRAVLDGAFIGLPKDAVPAAYATAHALVERIVQRRGSWGLVQLLAEMKQGRSFDEALQRSTAVTLDVLYADVVDSLE